MLDSVPEEDEAHLLVLGVVLVEVRLKQWRNLLGIRDHLVPAVLPRSPGLGVVAKNKLHLAIENVLARPLLLELDLAVISDEIHEKVTILVVDEAVGEDAHRLVAPQLGQYLGRGDLGSLDHQEALHHLGYIAQVEGVVRLGGDGL
eukprot:scaffold295678_cov28-Tisochrysis_lutea.AAC.3